MATRIALVFVSLLISICLFLLALGSTRILLGHGAEEPMAHPNAARIHCHHEHKAKSAAHTCAPMDANGFVNLLFVSAVLSRLGAKYLDTSRVWDT